MKKLFLILSVCVSYLCAYAQNGVNDSVCDAISTEITDSLCDTIDVNNYGISQETEVTTIQDLKAINAVGHPIDYLFIANDESSYEDEIPEEAKDLEETEDEPIWLIIIYGIILFFMVAMPMSGDCPL